MSDSLILRTLLRAILPLVVVLSLFMLFRSQVAPGGGFASGLLAACAVVLQAVVSGPAYVRQVLPLSYTILAVVGVFFALIWGALSMLAELPFLTPLWLGQLLPGLGNIGTPVLFNIGIYMTVVGVASQFTLLLMEETMRDAATHAPVRAVQHLPPADTPAEKGRMPNGNGKSEKSGMMPAYEDVDMLASPQRITPEQPAPADRNRQGRRP
jgi:multicomponent Na+:H+ antiporter subunit B